MYHKTSLVDPILINPQGFVHGLPEFKAVAPLVQEGDLDSAAKEAIELAAEGYDKVGKVWTELAFESVRTSEFPEAVSRLSCVFLFENALDAFEALGTWGSSPTVWRCEISEDLKTSRCDVDHFVDRQYDVAVQSAWQEKWNRAQSDARRYWSPGKNPTVEILVAGPVRLVERVHLRDFVA